MEFYTKIDIQKPDFSIDYTKKLALFGSCFADNISAQFANRGFCTLSNPFGTVYNPLSLAAQIRDIAEGKVFGEEDVFQDGCWNRDGQDARDGQERRGTWHCWDAHGSLSGKTWEECIDKLNAAANQAREFLQQADVVFVTLGTAFVYFLKDGSSTAGKIGGRVVANCHRQDPKMFERRMISVEEAADAIRGIVKSLRKRSPAANIVFTVSPLRHMADGAHENSLSKATLMLAVEKVAKCNIEIAKVPSTCSGTLPTVEYFPSYEIVMDELRDYRFYADDMIHLSETAEEYIFERMVDTYCSEATRTDIARVEKFLKMANHRIVDADSPATAEFVKKVRREADLLEAEIPGLFLDTNKNEYT